MPAIVSISRLGMMHVCTFQRQCGYIPVHPILMASPRRTTHRPNIRDLYPEYNDEELAAAEDAFERYLSLILRIFDRLEAGKKLVD